MMRRPVALAVAGLALCLLRRVLPGRRSGAAADGPGRAARGAPADAD